MKKLMALLAAGMTLNSQAQKIPKPDAYAKTITAADLKKHLYIIASPDMEGRETGTAGQRKAAVYIENYFKTIGLQPGAGEGFQQYYNLYQDSLVSATIEVNGKKFELDKDFSVTANTTQSTLLLSEVVVMGSGASDSIKSADLAGKLVLLTGSLTQNLYTQLIKKGPAAIITVSTSFPKTTPTNRKGRKLLTGFRKQRRLYRLLCQKHWLMQ